MRSAQLYPKAFRRGFQSHSAHAMLLALLFLGFLLSLTEHLLVHGLFSALPQSLWIRNASDTYSFHAYQLSQIQSHREEKKIILLGGSAMAWAVNAPRLEEALRNLDLDSRVYNLAYGNQTLFETLQVIETLPVKNTLVLLGLNPSLISRSPDEYVNSWRQLHTLHHSPKANAYLKAHHPKLSPPDPLWHRLIYRIKDQIWLRLQFPTQAPLKYLAPWQNDSALLPKQARLKRHYYIKRQRAKFPLHRDSNLRLLSHILNRASARQLRVALMDLPLHPDSLIKYQLFLGKKYQHDLKKVTKEHRNIFLSFNNGEKFESKHFRDAIHLLREGREKFENSLTAHIQQF